MIKIHRIRQVAPLLGLCAMGGLAALPPLLSGCASEPSQKVATEGDPPEGYASWEEYGEAQDKIQKDFEGDKARYRMQLERQRSGPMRR